MGLVFWALLFLERGVCLFRESFHLSLGTHATASRGLRSCPAAGSPGPSLAVTGASSLGPRPDWGPDGSQAPARNLRLRALESALAQPGAVTVSLEILTLSLPLNSLSCSFFFLLCKWDPDAYSLGCGGNLRTESLSTVPGCA